MARARSQLRMAGVRLAQPEDDLLKYSFSTGMAKLLLVRFVYVAAITTALLTINVRGQQNSTEPLTNASVVKLVKAGFKEKTIVAIIQSRPNRFKLDTEQLVQLKRQSVSENIILAMLSLSLPVMNSDDWGDDELFFNGTNKPADGDNKSPGGSTADIFGSSSGSKSQSRSRAANGGNENEGNIGGSATVRILRPPSEAGGAPAKLERTPTLTNDGVIRLVEAGFSEGTIIKRIEESPVEFDLSPAKLDELHKRRVTDPIIAAMTAAMSDETVKPGTPQPEREN